MWALNDMPWLSSKLFSSKSQRYSWLMPKQVRIQRFSNIFS